MLNCRKAMSFQVNTIEEMKKIQNSLLTVRPILVKCKSDC